MRSCIRQSADGFGKKPRSGERCETALRGSSIVKGHFGTNPVLIGAPHIKGRTNEKMRICITSSGNTLDSKVDPRFGRCPWFLFVETDDRTIEPIENPHVEQTSGAGVQSAQFVADHQPRAVLTGQCGPKAQQVLETAGITVITGCEGTAGDLVEQIREEGSAQAGLTGDQPPRGAEDPMNSTNAAAVVAGAAPMGMGRRHRRGQTGRGGRGRGGRGGKRFGRGGGSR
jgi:predicted Fe-Mo cluster-binding NifX family protein